MKHKLLVVLLCIIVSCSNKDNISALEQLYKTSAKAKNDTLEIESFEILNTAIVDYDYRQKLKINNLNYSIELHKMMIQNTKEVDSLLKTNISKRIELIKLDPKAKEKYLNEIELAQQKLQKNEAKIKNYETTIAITHQEIVLIKAELGQNKDLKFNLIDYVFKGTINGTTKIDTMTVLKNETYAPTFIKNNMITDYKGQ
jgi:hypothetical protein